MSECRHSFLSLSLRGFKVTQPISLSELKAQNSGEAEVEDIETEEVSAEADNQVTIDPIEDEPETTSELDTDEDDSEEESKPVKVESWMQEDSEESESNGFRPSPEAAAVRKKFKARLSQKDEELERLKAENEALKSTPQQTAQALPPRPKLEDFDYDEAKHEQALDDWYDKRMEAKAQQTLQSTQTEAQRRELAERQQKALNDALDKHYEGAAKLVADGKVSEERYTQAEDIVIRTLDGVSNGKGKEVTQHLIKTLNSIGEGSEKVMYQLGVNSAKRDRLIELMQNDPSGLAAATFLGQLQHSISSPTKRKSSAPKPMADLKGDAGGSTRADKAKRQYSQLDSVQDRISFKRQAKAKGIDTTNW
jgi:hypothetical protein